MPLYDYACPVCGFTTELMRSINNLDPVVCTECGAQMNKKITAANVRYKGSGWASTDKTHNEAGEKLVPRKPNV